MGQDPTSKVTLQKRTFAHYALLFAGFSLLLYLRRSAQLLHPQVWAEDGTQILVGLIDHGLRSLAYPVNGYLVTVPKLISAVSLSISGLFYPLVSTVITWVFIACVCVAIAVSPIWLKGGALLSVLTLLVPSDPEVFGVPLYSFWWASLLLFLVVLWDEQSKDVKFRVAFVLLGGLSSPLIFLVTPFLTIRTLLFREKGREAAVLLSALICCGMQGLAMHSTTAQITGGKVDIHNLRLILPRFVGSYIVGNFPHTTNNLLWFAAGFVVAFFVATIPFLFQRPRYLFLIGLWVGSIFFIAARVDLSIIHARLAGPRYFFIPFVLLSWYLVSAFADGSRMDFRWMAAGLILLSVLNTFRTLSRTHKDFRWVEHISSCNRFARYWIPISWDGQTPWFMDVSRQQCESLQSSSVISSHRRLDAAKSYPYTIRSLSADPPSGSGFADTSAILVDHWYGTDSANDTIPGFRVIGSAAIGDSDKGGLTLRLRKRAKVLFRAGPAVSREHISIEGGDRFLSALPPITEWVVLEFSNDLLPDEFTVTFSDDGFSGGGWSSVGLRE